jgi:hypothetical protein
MVKIIIPVSVAAAFLVVYLVLYKRVRMIFRGHHFATAITSRTCIEPDTKNPELLKFRVRGLINIGGSITHRKDIEEEFDALNAEHASQLAILHCWDDVLKVIPLHPYMVRGVFPSDDDPEVGVSDERTIYASDRHDMYKQAIEKGIIINTFERSDTGS